MNLEILYRQVEPGIALVELKGEADAFTAPRLRQDMMNWFDQGTTRFAVDLSQLTYIDSTNLGVLIGALKRARERGGDLAIVSPSPRVTRIFEITGLGTIFPVYDTREAALRSFRGNQDGQPGS